MMCFVQGLMASSNEGCDIDVEKNEATAAKILRKSFGMARKKCLNRAKSTNSVVTLPNEIDGSISNNCVLTTSVSSTLLRDHVETQRLDSLNEYNNALHTQDKKQQRKQEQSDLNSDNLSESYDVELCNKNNQGKTKKQHRKQLSTGSSGSNSAYYSLLGGDDKGSNLSESHKKRTPRTLKQNKSESAIPTKSLLELDPLSPIPSAHSLRSISPTGSRKSNSESISSNNSDNTAKRDEQSTAAAVASTTVVAATGVGALGKPAEKEKKRKEVSSSRVKKFHRQFSQVPKDEKLINYFSCALVSDILLQGHLYITDKHFAFYSNVFGYVTKVVIPTSSVTRISKEKTAKIIPNAVGVATADERHVFGSFISREAAFRLMCSVCPPLGVIELLPKTPADIEISEEYSIEDDSSCSISGNESPPGNGVIAATCNSNNSDNQALLRRTMLSSSLNSNNISSKKSMLSASNEKLRHSDIPSNAKTTSSKASNSQHHAHVTLRASAPAGSTTSQHKLTNSNSGMSSAATAASNLTMIIAAGTTTAISTTIKPSTATPSPSSSSSSPMTVMATPTPTALTGSNSSNSIAFHLESISRKEAITKAIIDSLKALTSKTTIRLKFPTELSVVYLGVFLSLVLAIFSVFLLYRIVDIEARATIYRSPMNFNWHSGHDDDIFAEALRWQRQLQDKSAAEAQNILSTNLEQIAKVRRSLETLSMLIRDRSYAAATATATTDDSSD